MDGIGDNPGGWRARLALRLEPRPGRTVLAHKAQAGPLTVQRGFYPEGAPVHLYLLHPPGGLVGGDELRIAADVAAGAHGLMTTPGAAKAYRSAGPMARVCQQFAIADGGVLEWLPQELILFPGARLSQHTRVQLSGGARCLGWEVLCLGRPVIGEVFDRGKADLRLEIERDGRPLLLERLALGGAGPTGLAGPAGAGLAGAAGLRGWPVAGTFFASGAGPDDLAAARAAWPPAGADLPGGLTLLGDLLVARALAARVEPLMGRFRALWSLLRPRLLGRPAAVPRIWAT